MTGAATGQASRRRRGFLGGLFRSLTVGPKGEFALERPPDRMNHKRGICGPILVSIGPVIGPVNPGRFRHVLPEKRQIVLPTREKYRKMPRFGLFGLGLTSVRSRLLRGDSQGLAEPWIP